MSECGLTNLAVCLPEKFFEYILSIFNAPLEPLLNLTKNLMSESVNIMLFHSFWAVIVYVISLFYGLFFMFAGVNFIISGYDAVKRENAKQWLRDIVLMVLFIQASFFIYALLIDLSARLTGGVLDIIPSEFFLLHAQGVADFGLQLIMLLPYLLVLVITIIFLGLRYLLVSIGVVLFPLAIFFYFIPPLKSYGKLILNILVMTIFITFFNAVILFGASQLMLIPIYQNVSIFLTISAFFTLDLLMIFALLFGIIKSVFSVLDSDIGRNVTRAIKYLV